MNSSQVHRQMKHELGTRERVSTAPSLTRQRRVVRSLGHCVSVALRRQHRSLTSSLQA